MEVQRERKAAFAFYNEPVSPTGRIYLRQEMELSIDCFVKFQNPIDVFAVKQALKFLAQTCPRLRSVVAEKHGRPRWRELPQINIDNLVIIVPEQDQFYVKQQSVIQTDLLEKENNNVYINKYIEALPPMAGLSRSLPLWEVHVLPRRQRCLVLRFHHALGDCVSLLALVLSCCDPHVEELAVSEDKPKRESPCFRVPLGKVARSTWRALKSVRYTLPFVIDLSARPFFGKANEMLVVQQAMEITPRKLASIVLSLDDFKTVKDKLNATVNDVFVGIVSHGILKYMRSMLSNEASEDTTVTGLVAVNIRGEGSKDILKSLREGKKIDWGNRVGYFTLPIQLKSMDNPLNYVRKAKGTLTKKKISYEAQFSYKISDLITNLFGTKTMALLDNRLRHKTNIFFSNIVGPSRPTRLAKNLITDIGVTLSSLSAAINVHLISYDGKAFLQFLVAEAIIPDPELLCVHVREALAEMVARALNAEDCTV
ncbi:wax ester synthase/diacylglycerol acyltransferase 2-like [Wolffia australiana]